MSEPTPPRGPAFYVTTPIYYVTAAPSIGNAYTTVAADMIARWHRQRGEDTWFLTGTDEHGQKVLEAASEHGVSPQEWTDKLVAEEWQPVLDVIDASNDDFIRTTEERHEGPVQKFVQALYDKGEVYAGTYKGLYCVGCEAFKVEDELVDGNCPLHGVPPEEVEEENYFFRLSKYADRLIELYESDERSVMPEARRNEVLGKVRQGLEDLSISRVSFDWGIPLPWDDKHVIYVWIDALQNYITAVGFGTEEERFDRVWPADIHLVGKDILWFHAVIWPAMLMALDMPVPRTVFAHGFLQVGGEKMSKSKLTGISPHDLIETFGSDGYRYYFIREISFGQDGNFSWESMVDRYNSDLANDLGNLASRVLSMINRYFEGVLPDAPRTSELTQPDQGLIASHKAALAGMEDAIDAIKPHDAAKAAWLFVRKANAYVEEVAPWALAKDPAQRRRLEICLYMLADSLRQLSLLVSPMIPRAAQELWERLGLQGEVASRTFPVDAGWGRLTPGTKVETGAPLFPRIDVES